MGPNGGSGFSNRNIEGKIPKNLLKKQSARKAESVVLIQSCVNHDPLGLGWGHSVGRGQFFTYQTNKEFLIIYIFFPDNFFYDSTFYI